MRLSCAHTLWLYALRHLFMSLYYTYTCLYLYSFIHQDDGSARYAEGRRARSRGESFEADPYGNPYSKAPPPAAAAPVGGVLVRAAPPYRRPSAPQNDGAFVVGMGAGYDYLSPRDAPKGGGDDSARR